MKSWPKIEQCIELMDVAAEVGRKKSNNGLEEVEKLVEGLLEIALRIKDPKLKAYFQIRVPCVMAKKWSAESTLGKGGLYVTNMLAPCLRAVDDKSLFLRTFVQSAGINDQEFVNRLLQRGKLLFRPGQNNFNHIGSYLYTLLSLNETPVWEPLLVGGGLDFVLQVFAVLSKDAHNSDGWPSSFEMSMTILVAASGTNKGYPFLLEMIKGGFLESFVGCGPHFANLNEIEITLCKGILALFSKYFFVFAVLKGVSKALEKLGGERRKKIRHTCLEESWVELETRLLEQLIRKSFLDIAYQGHKQEICRTVSG